MSKLEFVKRILTDTTLSTLAILISVAAFAVSYLQLQDARKHNRLSVKPIIQVVRNILLNPDSNQGLYHIHNDGTGPATFSKVEIYFKGQLINKPEVAAWRHIFKQQGEEKLGLYCLQIGQIQGSSMPPGDDHFILRIKDPKITQGQDTCNNLIARTRINNALIDTKIRVYYQSVYEQSFTAESRTPDGV